MKRYFKAKIYPTNYFSPISDGFTANFSQKTAQIIYFYVLYNCMYIYYE